MYLPSIITIRTGDFVGNERFKYVLDDTGLYNIFSSKETQGSRCLHPCHSVKGKWYIYSGQVSVGRELFRGRRVFWECAFQLFSSFSPY